MHSWHAKRGIHRHQTRPRSRNAARCAICRDTKSTRRHTAKRDVNHKTGSTQRSATPPEEDWATATGDLHTKFREDWSSGSRDMLADRQTNRRVDHDTPHPYEGGVIITKHVRLKEHTSITYSVLKVVAASAQNKIKCVLLAQSVWTETRRDNWKSEKDRHTAKYTTVHYFF